MAARVACKNLPSIYGFRERSVLAIILAVCMSTDSPPNPKIKAAEVKIVISSPIRLDTFFNPFVTSMNPFSMALKISIGMFSSANKGEKKLEIKWMICKPSKIFTKIAARTIYPHIKSRVEILL